MSWNPSAEELYVSWNAFKQLHSRGELSIDVAERQLSRAIKAGWIGFFGMFRNKRKLVLRRMLHSSADFHTAYEWGVDIVSKSGVPQHPKNLHGWLTKQT